ncbi:ankyrin repeat domain-containing protein [Ovoidimarina sediminis]|uniref:ankyrin repeat domain-containing protein n=1 Tax=Ovoidimarina sediminis TaxID=3079856 RepID=UPI002908073E|nr:ankyrin repeat domain-containing protein [Rhodophyticola sp. MJ-SS7]MDU8943489.1 ankyrin repeat domain-containing protein [Rhodophyticola sp. MJ-SS7]
MEAYRYSPLSGFLMGAVTIFLWAVVWFFGAAIGGGPPQTAGAAIGAVIGLTLISTGMSFLCAWMVLRLFGLGWSALIAISSLVLTAVIAGTEGWAFILLIFFVFLFPALGSVDQILLAKKLNKNEGLLGGRNLTAAIIVYLAALSALLAFTRPATFTDLHSLTYFSTSKLNLTAISRAISAGDDVNARTSGYYGGGTALHFAAKRDSPELIKMLLDAGADVSLRDDLGNTALHVAAKYSRSVDVVRELLNAGSDIHARSNTGSTPLLAAASRPGGFEENHAEVVILLIAAGADARTKSDLGDTPLYRAASAKDSRVLSAILEAGADVNAVSDWNGEAPLHKAAKYGDLRNIKLLIAAGADLNARDESGRTPLDLARSSGRAPAIIDALGHEVLD